MDKFSFRALTPLELFQNLMSEIKVWNSNFIFCILQIYATLTLSML